MTRAGVAILLVAAIVATLDSSSKIANGFSVIHSSPKNSQQCPTSKTERKFFAKPLGDDEASTFVSKRSHTRGIGGIRAALFGASILFSSWGTPVMLGDFTGVTTTAVAKEMASGTGSRVNKDPESLLRYGLPIPNSKVVRQLQGEIEDIRANIATIRKSAALDNVKKARQILQSKSETLANACREPSECRTIFQEMATTLDDSLTVDLKGSADAARASEQERKLLDKAYKIQDGLQRQLTILEEQMVPKGYAAKVPSIYSDLPQLQGGRATIEFVIRKPDNAPFDIEGTNYPEAKMTMIVDGYTAPVTAGNFVDLVQRGFYTKMAIQRSDGFVVQTGDPDGEADGFVGTPNASVGAGKHGERLIPLEIQVVGDSAPLYETTLEDDGRGGQATVLPFSSYGAMGWAREEYDPNTGSSQFFWLLFDSDLTPAGKNVLDGRYPCFGYVVEGADFLRDTKEGDVIVSAKVTKGIEFLVQPKEVANSQPAES